MPTYYRPKTVTLGGTTVTTVTQVTINFQKAAGNFAGDNDGVAAGWVGAGVLSGSITIGDPAQAIALIGVSGSLVVTMGGTGGAADYTITVLTMQVQGKGINQAFDANSAVTLPLVYVGASRTGITATPAVISGA